MLKKLSITIFILTVNISFIYAKNVVVNLACMPPEGTMEEDKKNDRLQPRENYYIYSDKMRITIKLIEVETSRIIAQEDFQGNKLDRPSKLATKIVKNMDKQIQKHFKMKK